MHSLLRVAACAALLCLPASAQAQVAVPSGLRDLSRVELAADFTKVQHYNTHIANANAARVARPRHRRRATIYGLATLGFIVLGTTQYMEFQRQLDIGDGSGSEVPGMIFAVSLGGALGGGLLALSHHGRANALAEQERRSLAGARALFPDRDPARR